MYAILYLFVTHTREREKREIRSISTKDARKQLSLSVSIQSIFSYFVQGWRCDRERVANEALFFFDEQVLKKRPKRPKKRIKFADIFCNQLYLCMSK